MMYTIDDDTPEEKLLPILLFAGDTHFSRLLSRHVLLLNLLNLLNSRQRLFPLPPFLGTYHCKHNDSLDLTWKERSIRVMDYK